MKRWMLPVIALLTSVAVVLSGCSGAGEADPDPSASDFRTIRIGKGISHESEVVAYLYAGVLSHAGYKTEVVDSPDSRTDYVNQMARGDENSVDVTPDYSGNLLLDLTDGGAKNPQATATPTASESDANDPRASMTPSTTPTPSPAFNIHGMSSSDISSTLPKVLPEGVTTFNTATAENKDALVVNQITAAKYKLSTIDDLAAHCKELKFGVPSGFKDKAYGSKGLQSLYGCEPGSYQEEDDQEKLSGQLADGSVGVADLFTASAAVKDNGYVVLEDPKANFIAQQVVPVARSKELPSPAKNAINDLSGKLGTGDLEFLNRLTTGDRPISAKDAARFWLKENDS
ncbi:ABC transporter substrate-binding protein [Rothia uropygialis]|uniref:ABC transporter substrate-binding protein n=1 Tax=Kocuria sp. 36 TaxID=1415402 RepID=UPI00101D45DD|nr:ABC transporter substrate-binding protein [Kocuria sp. 36]